MLDIIPKVPGFSERLGAAIGSGLGSGVSEGLNDVMTERRKQREVSYKERLSGPNSLQERHRVDTIRQYFGDEAADIYQAAPEGGKTAIIQNLLEQKARGLKFDEQMPENMQADNAEQNAGSQKSVSRKPSKFPPLEPVKGLTPKEGVVWERALRKENTPIFQQVLEDVSGSQKESDRLSILEDTSDFLPEGMDRLITTTPEGDIRPVAALLGKVNEPTQRFIKTLTDFMTTAQGTYGARVTNFDAQQHLKRFPGLLNTKEGRAGLIKQLRIFNKINSIYAKNLRDVYRHYGLGKITQEKAEEIAENMSNQEAEGLRDQLHNITREVEEKYGFQDLPDPSQYPNREMVDESTGQILFSDGQSWQPRGY